MSGSYYTTCTTCWTFEFKRFRPFAESKFTAQPLFVGVLWLCNKMAPLQQDSLSPSTTAVSGITAAWTSSGSPAARPHRPCTVTCWPNTEAFISNSFFCSNNSCSHERISWSSQIAGANFEPELRASSQSEQLRTLMHWHFTSVVRNTRVLYAFMMSAILFFNSFSIASEFGWISLIYTSEVTNK